MQKALELTEKQKERTGIRLKSLKKKSQEPEVKDAA